MEVGIRLVLFGYIFSNYFVIMSVEEMVKLCYSKGVLVLIDGVYVFGILLLDLSVFKVDYYVVNVYKWFVCFKVFLYILRYFCCLFCYKCMLCFFLFV